MPGGEAAVSRGATGGSLKGSWEGSRVGALEGSRVGSREGSGDMTPTPSLPELGLWGSGSAAGGSQERAHTGPQSAGGLGGSGSRGRGHREEPVAAAPSKGGAAEAQGEAALEAGGGAAAEAQGRSPAVGSPPSGAGSSGAAGLSVRVTDQFTCPITQVGRFGFLVGYSERVSEEIHFTRPISRRTVASDDCRIKSFGLLFCSWLLCACRGILQFHWLRKGFW